MPTVWSLPFVLSAAVFPGLIYRRGSKSNITVGNSVRFRSTVYRSSNHGFFKDQIMTIIAKFSRFPARFGSEQALILHQFVAICILTLGRSYQADVSSRIHNINLVLRVLSLCFSRERGCSKMWLKDSDQNAHYYAVFFTADSKLENFKLKISRCLNRDTAVV